MPPLKTTVFFAPAPRKEKTVSLLVLTYLNSNSASKNGRGWYIQTHDLCTPSFPAAQRPPF